MPGPVRATVNTHIVMVLDESASMGCVRDTTISGVNEYAESQKAIPGATIALTMFNSDGVRHLPIRPAEQWRPLTHDTYRPNACTPLYDAVGASVAEADRHLANRHDIDQVLFVVMTDGYENASREYDMDRVRKAIEEHPTWNFVFLGSNVDEWDLARKIGGVSPTMTNNVMGFENTAGSVRATYASLIGSTASYRGSGVRTTTTFWQK